MMDRDDAAPAPSTRRPSTAHDRPSRTPFGPRIRTKTKNDMQDASPPISPRLTTTYADAAVQTPTPQKSAFTAPPPLTLPPTVAFESTPIPWKGLPFEVAQWTFSSSELQEIVSKAIRLSARESFVRLLSLQALEVDIVHEAQRLDSERAAAQAKWRFEVGRRTMLMQALNSTVASSVPNGPSDAESENLVASFISQLASSIASCDSLLSSILHYSDQQSQIALIQHQHWASALGVALRKLNRAYERQRQELVCAHARVRTLEDELEEAWREAEKMAIEFDELEQVVAASEDESQGAEERPEEDIELIADAGAQAHDTHPHQNMEVKHDPDETGTLGDVTINTDIGIVLGVTATAVASKATLVNSPGSPKPVDKSDTKSIRSVKSTRSRRSIRDGPTHVSRMSAARTRSRAASNASLRLPKALRSIPSTHTSPDDAPPIPALPSPNIPGQSFLDMGSLVHESARKGLPPPHPEPKVALPIPPHSAGLTPTRVPSIWLETDGGKSTRLNGLDRTHSLQIFSSLTGRTPKKVRRSNLVMSLTGSDRGSDSATGSPIEGSNVPVLQCDNNGARASVGTGSPVSVTNGSPVSLPHFHFRGPSASSSSNVSLGVNVGVGAGAGRPGSAGARLTTTWDTRTPVPVGTPRRSLVSRASSVILRRLSQATMGSVRMGGGKGLTARSRSREGLRLSGTGHTLSERWRERERESSVEEGDGEGEGEGEGEVMLIGSLHADSLYDP